MPKNRFVKTGCFTILTLIILYFPLEYASRAVYNLDPEGLTKIVERDSVFRLRNKPNVRAIIFKEKVPVETDSNGFRLSGRAAAGENAIKIFCMGDSTTFGYRVSGGETYCARLQKLLNENNKGRPYECFNAGVIGMDSENGLKVFENKILKLKPEIVIVSYALNDSVPAYLDVSPASLPFVSSRPALLGAFNFINSHSNLYRIFASAFNRGDVKIAKIRGRIDINTRRVPPDVYLNTLKKFAKNAETNSVKLVLFFAPVDVSEKGFWMDDALQYHDLMRRAAAENNVTMVDIQPIPHDCFADHYHINAKGHSFAAEKLYKVIR